MAPNKKANKNKKAQEDQEPQCEEDLTITPADPHVIQNHLQNAGVLLPAANPQQQSSVEALQQVYSGDFSVAGVNQAMPRLMGAVANANDNTVTYLHNWLMKEFVMTCIKQGVKALDPKMEFVGKHGIGMRWVYEVDMRNIKDIKDFVTRPVKPMRPLHPSPDGDNTYSSDDPETVSDVLVIQSTLTSHHRFMSYFFKFATEFPDLRKYFHCLLHVGVKHGRTDEHLREITKRFLDKVKSREAKATAGLCRQICKEVDAIYWVGGKRSRKRKQDTTGGGEVNPDLAAGGGVGDSNPPGGGGGASTSAGGGGGASTSAGGGGGAPATDAATDPNKGQAKDPAKDPSSGAGVVGALRGKREVKAPTPAYVPDTFRKGARVRLM
jgi:hypothetical protein